MLRDRIVAGIVSDETREKLLAEKNLTLDRATEICRASESAQEGIAELKKTEIGRLEKSYRTYQQNKGNKGNGGKNNTYNNNTSGFDNRDTSLLACKFCSRKHKFGRGACPAWGKSCLKCGGENHFASVCTKQQTKQTNSIASKGGEDEEFPFKEALFLGSLETGAALQVDRVQGGNQESWEIWLPGNNGKLKFKIDTGAKVSVVGTKQLKIFNKQIMDLTKTRKTLIGPDQKPLSCHGVFQQKFTIGSTSGIAQLYACDNLKTALLGRPELKKFKLEIPAENDIACDSVQHETKNIQKEFSSVFTGLGTIKGNPIHIEVEPNTVPYHIGAPRRVAIPFLEPLKKELERMQKLGVIITVDKPTEWCHPVVLVEKANGDLRICIDLTKLNKNTKREFYELPSVDETLAKLGNKCKFMAKLDANSGYWQLQLETESQLKCTFTTPFGRFCPTRAPFGLTSLPKIFSKKMDIEKLNSVVKSMDDFLVFGDMEENYSDNL